MDALIAKRVPIRGVFTRRYNKLMTMINEGVSTCEEVEIQFSSFERTANDLALLDEEICNLLVDAKSESLTDEYEKIEEYKEKTDAARIKVKIFMDKFSTFPDRALSVAAEKTKLKLPKIELVKFSGEIKDWLSFWSQFSRIHEDEFMSDEDKFQYLIQSMVIGSRAKEIVDSYPPSADNYAKVIESLKTRFGREELLVEYYVRELLTLVVKNVMNTKTKMNIMQLYDKLESYLRSLESIGVTKEKYAAMLFPLVESCIPEDLLRVWLRNPVISKEGDSYGDKLSQLLSFLRAEVEGEERISLAKTGFKHTDASHRKRDKDLEISTPVSTANDLLSEAKSIPIPSKLNCIFCGKQHNSENCFKGQKLPLAEKQEILKKQKACFSCLKVGHRSKNCKANIRCIVCSKKHWPVLCPELIKSNKTLAVDISAEENTTLSNQSQPEILLQTLLVVVESDGKSKTVRALCDTGSQRSYILKSTIQELGLATNKSETLTHVVFGGASSRKQHRSYNLRISNMKKNNMFQIQVLDQHVICGYVPSLKEGPWMSELREKGIEITDVGKSSQKIELLIGADYIGKFYTGKTIQLKCGLVAIETYLGWIVMGKTNHACSSMGLVSTSLFIQSNSLPDLWKLETIGITDPCETITSEEFDAIATEHFLKTVKINQDGRYEISLPWVRNVDDLLCNRDIAEKRLKTVTTKLTNGKQLDSYHSVFVEWSNEGFIEESNEGTGHYLPHRGVFKSNSTTKVRPVFDASCKTKGNLSLNDCLMKGPNLLKMIPALLIKFRENQIGVISDIEKAFLQISVNKDDRRYLKFLWWEDKDTKTIKVFQHARVVFGLNCSPFLLGAVIQHHLNKYESSNVQDVATKLKKSFYVDNCVTSVDSEKELKRFIECSTDLMAAAKFNLRGWEFTEKEDIIEKPEPSRVLGLLWDKSEDVLFCDTRIVTDLPEIITRRVMLSFANRVFDPIGFTCPITLWPKILLQTSWHSKLSWDSEVSEDVKKKFLKWLEDLNILHTVKIPRKAILSNSSMSLHVFCDASGLSYAAVIFIRCVIEYRTTVQLLMAKSRVAPLKKMSIPRLELLSCCIGARLADFVKKALEIENIDIHYWSDSTTVLHWIQRDEPWSVFVRNRVKEIRMLSSGNWRHVPGQSNPADLPSRGCSVTKLLSSRWWEGPSWLYLPENAWPQSEYKIDEEVIDEEREKRTTILMNNNLIEANKLFSYFSSYTRNVRMIGWILRFFENSKLPEKDRKKGELSLIELEKSEIKLLKIIQNETFTADYIKSLKSLNVFKDEKGIYRIKTKLTEREDTKNFRLPILLPGKHTLVDMLIKEKHLKCLHAGPQILLSNLRENFWIINGRRAVRRIIKDCVRCKRYNTRSIKTAPVGLPQDRVKETSVFEVVGIDLAGPLYLKEGGKSWIVIYTCAVYRAIHLELVLSLSTKAFLLSLRRFIARRGRPHIIYCDNGSNFTGAENLLQTLNWKSIEAETSICKIEWKFIPPSAPWWGGFWEIMVKMVKNLLRRVLGKACISYEEMVSILCDCESVINSRPLTCLTEDMDDLIPLTPSMFLQEIPTVGVPDLDKLDQMDLNRRYKYQQTLRDQLRKRFRREYLATLLQPRKKENYYELKVGDIVLIENDSKRKIHWPMAKVIAIYPGKDEKVRVVRLKTAHAEILRPVQRIYPLEIRSIPIEKSEVSTTNGGSNQEDSSRVLRKIFTTRSGRTVKMPSRYLDS